MVEFTLIAVAIITVAFILPIVAFVVYDRMKKKKKRKVASASS